MSFRLVAHSDLGGRGDGMQVVREGAHGAVAGVVAVLLTGEQHMKLVVGAVGPLCVVSPLVDGRPIVDFHFGDDQCVNPGMMTRSMSACMSAHCSPSSGACCGTSAARYPGSTRALTGLERSVERYSVIWSTSA